MSYSLLTKILVCAAAFVVACLLFGNYHYNGPVTGMIRRGDATTAMVAGEIIPMLILLSAAVFSAVWRNEEASKAD